MESFPSRWRSEGAEDDAVRPVRSFGGFISILTALVTFFLPGIAALGLVLLIAAWGDREWRNRDQLAGMIGRHA